MYVTDETDYQFRVGEAVMEQSHPSRGATRALSYGPQNMFEDRFAEFIGALRSGGTASGQPHAVFFGQFHREIVFFYGGTLHVLVPGLQLKTGWEHGKGLIHQVGAWVLEMELAKNEGSSFYNTTAFELRYIDLFGKTKKRSIRTLQSDLVQIALK